MEFFEKEFNVKFIDLKTGKKALDIIKGKERNGNNCKWIIYGDGQYLHEEDSVCGNNESDYLADFVNGEMTCEFWSQGSEKDE